MMGAATVSIQKVFADVIQRRRDAVFLIDANHGRQITYADFDRLARGFAVELLGRGIQKGDRIAVMFPNCCELAIIYFACIYAGIVIVPIDPSLSKTDVHFILSNSKPHLIVASQSSPDWISESGLAVIRISGTAAAFGGSSQSAYPHSPHPDLAEPNSASLNSADRNSADRNLKDLIELEHPTLAENFVPLATVSADDLVAIMYTSGTSAKPKGLAHKLGSMLRNATVFAGTQRITEETRFYLTLSMSYMGGFYNLLILPFLCGASVLVDHVFDARSSLQFWDKARRHDVNALWLAPTVISILLRMDRGSTGEQFCRHAVRHAFVGFAPLPLKVKDEFESRYGIRLIENYGLSEVLFVSARSGNCIGTRGYVGEPLPGVELRIVDECGKTVAPPLEGEIEILTSDVMAGYLDADGELIATRTSDWFPSGDIGRQDENGSLFVTGRKKDLVIRGGVNISPAAIEESLMQVAGVIEAAVVGIPHELYGEDIVAVLKLEPPLEIESMMQNLITHTRNTLAQHQQPARYIAIDELPRTSNGKIKKSRIRELVVQKLHLGNLRGPAAHSAEIVGISK